MRNAFQQIISVLFFGFYVEWSGSFVPTFRDNLPIPSSSAKDSKKNHILSYMLQNLLLI
jgi:hypothetical protein